MWYKDTAQGLEGKRVTLNGIFRRGAELENEKDSRWFAGVLGYFVLISCLQLVTWLKALALP